MGEITEQDWDDLEKECREMRERSKPLTWTTEPLPGPQGKPKHVFAVQVNGQIYVRDAKNKLNLGPLPEVPE